LPTIYDLCLRHTAFLDDEQRPDDYEVRYNSQTVGRILRLNEAKAAFPGGGERARRCAWRLRKSSVWHALPRCAPHYCFVYTAYRTDGKSQQPGVGPINLHEAKAFPGKQGADLTATIRTHRASNIADRL
jgi:hypothetical protein